GSGRGGVPGAIGGPAAGVGAPAPPAMISLSPDLRQAEPVAPGQAAPSHGICSSQNRLNLLRVVACDVSRTDVVRNDAATAAGLFGSGAYVHFVGSPALRFANIPGTVRWLPSSRNV